MRKSKKENNECNDKSCPFHGNLSTHGNVFVGKVISNKMHRTVTVSWERRHFIPKFERYERRWSRIKAHNSDCISAKENDFVEIKECRPLSKTKSFVVIKIIGKDEKALPKVELYGEEIKVKKAE